MPRLFSIAAAAIELGGISAWTLRKHISRGQVAVTRIGRRVLLPAEEVERIRKDGLPSLTAQSRHSLISGKKSSNQEKS